MKKRAAIFVEAARLHPDIHMYVASRWLYDKRTERSMYIYIIMYVGCMVGPYIHTNIEISYEVPIPEIYGPWVR
jgi:hypothetical protein